MAIAKMVFKHNWSRLGITALAGTFHAWQSWGDQPANVFIKCIWFICEISKICCQTLTLCGVIFYIIFTSCQHVTVSGKSTCPLVRRIRPNGNCNIIKMSFPCVGSSAERISHHDPWYCCRFSNRERSKCSGRQTRCARGMARSLPGVIRNAQKNEFGTKSTSRKIVFVYMEIFPHIFVWGFCF